MKAGWIGLGKLGLPCALTLARYGRHDVAGYDVSDAPRKALLGEIKPHREQGLDELLDFPGQHRFRLVDSVDEVIRHADVVVVAVQTPHDPAYGGERAAPGEPRNFDYTRLKDCMSVVAYHARMQRKHLVISVLSTVLPGTMQREILPLGNEYTTFAYSPVMISLGTAVRDYRFPEFVICGADSPDAARATRELYRWTGAEVLESDFATAELTKMGCNAYTTMQITFVNTLMEMAQKTGADVSAVTRALRKFKPGFVPDAGMPDGGPCRPRDLIALSWLAQQHDLSYDMTGSVARGRESQARWLASLGDQVAEETGLPVVLTDEAYKPGSDLTSGSPARLLRSFLRSPAVFGPVTEKPSVYVITVRSAEFSVARFPEGSVVLDPWGIVRDQDGVQVIRVGRH